MRAVVREPFREGRRCGLTHPHTSEESAQMAPLNMPTDLIRRFHSALPEVRNWIDEFLLANANASRLVSDLSLTRLSACFSTEVMERTRVVLLDRVPFPPVEKFGLPEFEPMQRMEFSGITFRNTYFLQRGCESESLHFHELVHIVQWGRLGIDKFLLAYGLGLVLFGYAQSPLEQMAYNLQRSFELGTTPQHLVRVIEQGTDAIWNEVAPVVYPRLGLV
jgi:hypothetical protein